METTTCELAERLERKFTLAKETGNQKVIEKYARIAREKVTCLDCLAVVDRFVPKP